MLSRDETTNTLTTNKQFNHAQKKNWSERITILTTRIIIMGQIKVLSVHHALHLTLTLTHTISAVCPHVLLFSVLPWMLILQSFLPWPVIFVQPMFITTFFSDILNQLGMFLLVHVISRLPDFHRANFCLEIAAPIIFQEGTITTIVKSLGFLPLHFLWSSSVTSLGVALLLRFSQPFAFEW